MKYISVVVPEDVDRQLRFACADQATTKSRLVRKLIEQYLDEWRTEFDDKTLEALKEDKNIKE